MILVKYLNGHSIKWIIFTVLFLTVPAIFFLVMAVMFVPAVYFVGGIGYVIPKLFIPKSSGESFTFILIMGVHLLIYTGFYYGISALLAKAVTLVKGSLGRLGILMIICSSLVLVTRLRIYGGGGHGPVHWRTLGELSAEINKSYGSGTAQLVYGSAVLILCSYLWWRNRVSKYSVGHSETA